MPIFRKPKSDAPPQETAEDVADTAPLEEAAAPPSDEHEDALSPPSPVAVPLTDEGVPFAPQDHEHIVNLSRDPFDAKRRELHVGARPYHHTADAADGSWIYRLDR